jgi:hypothetical protein
MMKTAEDEEFERIEAEGWRKRQIEQMERSELCSNYGGFCKKEWVGLTDEEINAFEIWLDNEEEKIGWNPPPDIVKYLEAKLRSKNT